MADLMKVKVQGAEYADGSYAGIVELTIGAQWVVTHECTDGQVRLHVRIPESAMDQMCDDWTSCRGKLKAGGK